MSDLVQFVFSAMCLLLMTGIIRSMMPPQIITDYGWHHESDWRGHR